jgi:hypothetical protein
MRALLLGVLTLAGCVNAPAPVITSNNNLLKLRTAEWHSCIAREFQTAMQGSASRSVAAEFALGLCRTEENAIIGSAELPPSETTRVLMQAKADLKQRMIAGPSAPAGKPQAPNPRRYGI